MKQYLDLLNHVLENGEAHDDRTGVGTISVFGYQFRHNMKEGFPLLTTKRVPFRWVAEELFWFLRGSTFEPDLRSKGVDIWAEWATAEQTRRFGRREGDLGPVYGFLWRNFGAKYLPAGSIFNSKPLAELGGVDQLERLMNDIRDSPGSRRHIVTGWDPAQCDNVALPPCHTLWQIKCHEAHREMSLHLYARSIDSFLGLPFNIASYGLLLELISTAMSYHARDLIITFGDLHIYKNHLDQVQEQLRREPRPLPRLEILRSRNNEAFTPSPLAKLMAFEYSDLFLSGYDPHPTIKAPVAI